MRLAFFGTPVFANEFLKSLLSSNHEVLLVVSVPDKPAGRGKKIHASEVAIFARENNIKLIQPESTCSKEFLDLIDKFNIDVCIVVSYGKIIRKELLDLPKHGFINIHPSLLPKYRGSTPIESAIMAGEMVSGITIMRMNEKLDAGDIIIQSEFDINSDDNYGDILNKVSEVGPKLMLDALEMIENDTVKYKPQKESEATYTRKIEKDDLKINWYQKSREIHNKVRSIFPIRSCYTYLADLRIEILQTELTEQISILQPGTILNLDKEDIIVATMDYDLKVLRLKPENRKDMSAAAFARGYSNIIGCKFI